MQNLLIQRPLLIKYWLPPLVAGGLAGIIFLLVGNTPILRASGMALVIVGMALALRRMGTIVALMGSFTLMFSPAFWSQTGGGDGGPATIVIALIAATIGVSFIVTISKRPDVGLGLGILIFVGFFISQLGTPQSLRLTSFIVSWLLFLVIDMLLLTNPHPDDHAPPILRPRSKTKSDDEISPADSAQPYHTLGLMLLFGIGVLNDPLLVLLSPALILSVWLSRTNLPAWYWGAMMLIVGVGLRGFVDDYLQAQATMMALHEWRYGARWVDLTNLIIGQFGFIGLILGVLGLARLARWYPPLGSVTMVAYAAYALFGLIYDGANRPILLLPLFIIQVVWMSYAVFALGEWVNKSLHQQGNIANQIVYLLYGLLPVLMLINILNG